MQNEHEWKDKAMASGMEYCTTSQQSWCRSLTRTCEHRTWAGHTSKVRPQRRGVVLVVVQVVWRRGLEQL